MLDAEGALMLTQWSLGHLEQIGFDGVILLAIAMVVMLVGLLYDQRKWQLLVLGEEWAKSHGVHPRPVQLRTLGFAALGVAVSVAFCGPITFVGLLAPHLCRFFIRGQLHRLVPHPRPPARWAYHFAMQSQLLASTSGAASQIPVGAISGAIGAPLLILLMLNRSREAY